MRDRLPKNKWKVNPLKIPKVTPRLNTPKISTFFSTRMCAANLPFSLEKSMKIAASSHAGRRARRSDPNAGNLFALKNTAA